MLYEELSLDKSVEAFDRWVNGDFQIQNRTLPNLSNSYQDLRNKLIDFFLKNIHGKDDLDDYEKDVLFAIYLYECLKEIEGFSMRVAENDGFWRHLSLIVVPNLVSLRWENSDPEKNNGLPDHFYRKSVRIWLKSLWWYVHLSWYRSSGETSELLLSNNFSTDTILNLVERSGRFGTYVEVYRAIMYYYGNMQPQKISSFAKKFEDKNNGKLFRVLMKLNTAKLVTLNPELYLGGVDGYVKRLFEEAGTPVC